MPLFLRAACPPASAVSSLNCFYSFVGRPRGRRHSSKYCDVSNVARLSPHFRPAADPYVLLIVSPRVNIGKYNDTTIKPITPPKKIMMAGSIKLSIASTADSTSAS